MEEFGDTAPLACRDKPLDLTLVEPEEAAEQIISFLWYVGFSRAEVAVEQDRLTWLAVVGKLRTKDREVIWKAREIAARSIYRGPFTRAQQMGVEP